MASKAGTKIKRDAAQLTAKSKVRMLKEKKSAILQQAKAEAVAPPVVLEKEKEGGDMDLEDFFAEVKGAELVALDSHGTDPIVPVVEQNTSVGDDEDEEEDDEEEASEKERLYYDRDEKIVDAAYSAKLDRLKSIQALMSKNKNGKAEEEKEGNSSNTASASAASDSEILALGAEKVLNTFFDDDDESSSNAIDAGSIEALLRKKKE